MCGLTKRRKYAGVESIVNRRAQRIRNADLRTPSKPCLGTEYGQVDLFYIIICIEKLQEKMFYKCKILLFMTAITYRYNSL